MTGLLLTLALAMAGGWGAYAGAREYALAARSVRWPSAEGRIVRSELVPEAAAESPHTFKADIE